MVPRIQEIYAVAPIKVPLGTLYRRRSWTKNKKIRNDARDVLRCPNGGRIVGRTKHSEIDIDSLAAIQPCMSRVMPEYTERYGILYHACKARNWEFGSYELKEIKEIAEVGKKLDRSGLRNWKTSTENISYPSKTP